MIGLAARYRELLMELLLSRELAGGSLPESIESDTVEELDRCWWALTAAEQAAIESELNSDVSPTAELDLRTVDSELTSGSRVLPRRAA